MKFSIFFLAVAMYAKIVQALRSSLECVRWAQDGECIKNPRYLWAHCLAACMDISRDDHDLCSRWAQDGECSKNPAYVHIHCPQSCGHSIGWSPVTRKILDIDFIPIEPIYLLPHECLEHNDAFLAGLALQNRLKHMFDASVFDGISTNAPNEFLMNYGLAEAVLYAMRLYDVVVKSLDDYVLNTKSEEAMSFVLSNLSYDGDAIGRSLPQFYFSLEGLRMAIIHKISALQQQQQQLLQQNHGLKDTYLRDNFANVKPNACSVFLDQNWSSIVHMYGAQLPYTTKNVVPQFEFLRTLDSSDDADIYGYNDDGYEGNSNGLAVDEDRNNGKESERAAAVDGASKYYGESEEDEDEDGEEGTRRDLTDAEVDTLMALGDHEAGNRGADSPTAVVVNDNCFNSDGSRLEPKLCYLLNKQKVDHDRDVTRREQELAKRAIGFVVQTTKVVQPYMTLLNGAKMPALGLGTWELSGLECEATVYDAIRMGYRHIDTSQAYGNEGEIGRAIKRAIDEGIVTRNDLFVSTKISFQKDSGRNVFNLVHMQLEKLKLNYIDLYMIHSHMASPAVLKATWHSITQMYYDGIIRAAGVSNFNSQQLEDLIALVKESREENDEGEPQGNFLFPMVLQNKFDVYHTGKQLDHRGEDVRALCRQHGIRLLGYSPLSSFPFVLVPRMDPLVQMVAARRGVQEAEVILQWALQQGVAVIPRSANRSHLRDNLLAASKLAALSSGLTAEEMKLLSSISSLVSTPYTIVKHSQWPEGDDDDE